MTRHAVEIPDIGDFADVPVVEICVAVGDTVEIDDPILMLESDKATLDIPSPVSGKIAAVLVKEGDKVGQGSIVMQVDVADTPTTSSGSDREQASSSRASDDAEPKSAAGPSQADSHAELLVIGAGPGGYTAAFRAADLGMKVVLVERWPTLGGVCLNVGCIPSKALLHAAKVIDDAAEMRGSGVRFEKPRIDLDELRNWKNGVVGKLTGGLENLARRRKVKIVRGTATFEGSQAARILHEDSETRVTFDQAIIACGSEPVRLPFLPDDKRIIDSTGALSLEGVPQKMLVLGGGIIGLEMAQVYQSLGATVAVVELMDQLIPGADADIVAPLMKRVEQRYERVLLQTKVTRVDAQEGGLDVTFEGPEGTFEDRFDRILLAVGRKPNGAMINAVAAGVAVDEGGFIPVDGQMRTNQPHIFAIGDVVGQPMLAHKAVHEGKVAAEVAAGRKSSFDALVIPSVAYTDPEVAWVGLTETEAGRTGITYKKASFPWAASGRALSMGRQDGVSKLLFDPSSGRVLGAGLAGPNAGELLAQVALAIEMGADAEDIALTIHPHPTLSETISLTAEIFEGTITDF